MVIKSLQGLEKEKQTYFILEKLRAIWSFSGRESTINDP